MTEHVTLSNGGVCVFTNFDEETKKIIVSSLQEKVSDATIDACIVCEMVADILDKNEINNVLFSVAVGIHFVMIDGINNAKTR